VKATEDMKVRLSLAHEQIKALMNKINEQDREIMILKRRLIKAGQDVK
jgi:hypothetical protein